MKPLEGIRVVDLSTMLAGPMTGRILAEWGADVIKVETMNGMLGASRPEPPCPPARRTPTPILTCRT